MRKSPNMSFLFFIYPGFPNLFSENSSTGSWSGKIISLNLSRPRFQKFTLPALLLLLPRSHIPVAGESLQYYDKTLLLPYAAGYHLTWSDPS